MKPATMHPEGSLYSKNLKHLQEEDPFLARRVADCQDSPDIEVIQSRAGLAIPRINGISLHSAYDPQKEAVGLIANQCPLDGKQTVFLGLGFGYHLQAWLKVHRGTVWVIEPSLALFRTFLHQVDLETFESRVRFLVEMPVPRLLARLKPETWHCIVHPPSLQIYPEYFKDLEEGGDLLEDLVKRPLRILVVPPIYGGSLPTARYCVDALKSLGHQVSLVECDRFQDSFFAIQKVTPNKDHSQVLAERFMGLMDEVIVAKAAEFRPDFILALAQAPLGESAIKRLRVLQVPIAFWFVEDFRTLTYWKEMAPLYDYFFTIQQGEFLDQLEKLGVSRSYYLPQGCHRELHQPKLLTLEERKEFGAEVSFMGAAYFNRVQSFQQLLDLNLKIWGTGWDPASVYGRCLQKNGDRVSSVECVNIFNGSTINLNLHSSTFHEGVNPNGDFVNPRTFEIAACGAFQLVDKRSELPDLFRIGEEIAVFSTMAELRERIEYYLKHPGERRRISQAGRERVMTEHTMQHRMQEMLLEVFRGKRAWLQGRREGQESTLEILMREAGPETELGRYLSQFEDKQDLSIKKIKERIEDGEGRLSQNELLLLMVDQVVK